MHLNNMISITLTENVILISKYTHNVGSGWYTSHLHVLTIDI